MNKNRIMIVLFLVLVCCMCARDHPSQIRIAYQSLVTSLDPIRENTLISNSIYFNVYETLVKRNLNMKIVPGLAVSWSNPDDRTCIFKIRPGLRFHNGAPLRSKDVRFSLERARNDPSSQLSSYLTMLERVEVTGPDLVTVVTRKPYSVILNRLADIWIVPEKSFSSTGSPSRIIPGTGPYVIKDWKSGEFVLLGKNERYWGEKPSVSQIRFETVPDFEKRIVGLIEGTIDILPMLEPSALENKLMLQEAEKLRVQSIPGLMLLYLGMDVFREKTPYVDLPKNPFRDIRVRKAVYQAINIQSIVRDILKGHGTAATQLVAPNVFGHNDRIQRPAYDPKAARELLMQAGYLNGFRVRLDITKNRYRDDIEIGRAIVRDLEAVGIQVQLNAIDKDILFRKRDLRDTSFYMAGWMDSSADALSTFDFLIHTPDPKRNYGTANGAGYSNPEVDRLVERSSEELVPSSRISLLEKAMELTMMDLAFIPLHVENNVTATANHIQWRLRSDELVNASDIHLQQ